MKKMRRHVVLLVTGLLLLPLTVSAVAIGGPAPSPNPSVSSPQVKKVVQLLAELRDRVEEDGRLEQASYDKYSCWCERTLERKAADIANGKKEIERLQNLILQLQAELGSHKADIAQLKKDISENKQAQEKATEMRQKAQAEFAAEKTESEQCLGALDVAIKTLTGAGTGKFLQTLHQAELISVATGMHSVIKNEHIMSRISEQDLQVVKHFMRKPVDFVSLSKGRGSNTASSGYSAVQLGQNPFGDYAPQSTQIQGILKEMEASFQKSMAEAEEEEAKEQKAYDELMGTKRAEMDTLTDTLQVQETEFAAKSKVNAESKLTRDDTIAQVKADEAFFAETKENCKQKAIEWAERCRLRTEELQGIAKAIDVLSKPDSELVFGRSYTTLLQMSSLRRSRSLRGQQELTNSKDGRGGRAEVAAKLRSLAASHHSTVLSAAAASVQAGGFFDKVIAMIDQTMEVLRQEEKDDIAHRDRCQQESGKNSNKLADLDNGISKSQREINRLGDEISEVKTNIGVLTDEIDASNKQLGDLLDLRNQEAAEFKQALKDDVDAIALIENAIAYLTKFYTKNKVPLELRQKSTGGLTQEPEYYYDPDKPPETVWSGSNYGGRKSESGGIISILSMIKEDIENEIKTGRAEEDQAQELYAKTRSALELALKKDTASEIQQQKNLAELHSKVADVEEHRDQQRSDWTEQKGLETSLGQDCQWVQTHFDSRRAKRKAEMAGLVDAKTYLQGVEDGTAEDDLE